MWWGLWIRNMSITLVCHFLGYVVAATGMFWVKNRLVDLVLLGMEEKKLMMDVSSFQTAWVRRWLRVAWHVVMMTMMMKMMMTMMMKQLLVQTAYPLRSLQAAKSAHPLVPMYESVHYPSKLSNND